MKNFAIIAVVATLALSACAGGGTTAGRTLAQPTSAQTLTPYRVPLTHSAAIDAAAALGAQQPGLRKPSDLGSTSTFNATIAILDAPRFGTGAQVNVAILGVEAVGADGIAYDVINYTTPMVVNMLAYQSSALVLGHALLPRQNYTTLRLVVKGSASSVVAWNTTYRVSYGYYDFTHVFTPAPSDISTVDFPVHLNMSTGDATLLADFNTVESVKIRAGIALIGSRFGSAPYSDSSVIVGTVANAAGTPVDSAVVAAVDANGNVAATTLTGADGSFEVHAIVGGVYHLVVHNDYVAASGDRIVANGADGTADVSGPTVAVPGGFKITIGPIAD